MHSYNGLFDNMLSEASMNIAFHDASKGKTKRNDVQRVLLNLEDRTSKKGKVVKGEKTKLKEILKDEKLILYHHETCRINEVNCHKERDIVKPFFKYEQVVHHLVVGQLKPIVMKGFYEYSCGSIPNRGCHYGKKYIEKWIRSYPKDKTVYVLKMDIKHFFENVDHDILKNKLARVIRDKKFLRLVYKIIDNHEVGLPLGYYTSQWFANFYLKDFDHYVKEVLKAPHYMRYMDDMVIISDNKEQLHLIRQEIEEYLNNELNVELKDNWQVFPLAENSYNKELTKEQYAGRPLDFMGFKFYRTHTTMRKSILCRARHKANRIYSKQRVTWRDATAMISYMGWITHTNTYMYFQKYVKPKVTISTLKWRVSKHNRKENKRNDRLEASKRNADNKTFRGRYLFQYQNCLLA